MTTRVVMNGKEITNPFIKFALAIGLIVVTALFVMLIVFFVLPLVGIVLTLSIGFIAVFLTTLIAGFAALLLSTAVFGRFFGTTEFRIEKTAKRK